EGLPFPKVVCWKAYCSPFLIYSRFLEGVVAENHDVYEQNTHHDRHRGKHPATPVIAVGPPDLNYRDSPVQDQKQHHHYQGNFAISLSSIGLHSKDQLYQRKNAQKGLSHVFVLDSYTYLKDADGLSS